MTVTNSDGSIIGFDAYYFQKASYLPYTSVSASTTTMVVRGLYLHTKSFSVNYYIFLYDPSSALTYFATFIPFI